mgnify:CR=1 FL=1
MPSGDAHRSLARALDILELCSLNGSGYTLTQLSQQLGIAKGSISPLLHTLGLAGALAVGALLVASFVRLFQKRREHRS